ncbi:MAG TPA: hypothetical protein VMU19_13995 [Bryobacteraceae bacterium]|nr:hypothetical protein [Bryobacteraceae bacterium]
MRLTRILAVCAIFAAALGQADVRGCVCDLASPETASKKECSLCREVERRPQDPQFFVIPDADPKKPNRRLALPRFHGVNPQELSQMTLEQRTAYWTVAIHEAEQLWGDGWGLAVNALANRGQCHMHIHIGKRNAGVEDERFQFVKTPAEFPLPRPDDGIWVHPVAGGYHVHWGDKSPELLLQR